MNLLPPLFGFTHHDPALVRLTIKAAAGDDPACKYTVEISPRWCPRGFQRGLRQGLGRLPAEAVRALDATFPNVLAAVVGVPDGTVLALANECLVKHAAALCEVLWGETVWGEAGREVFDWWTRLYDAVRFLIIELDLDPTLQKYVWESVLLPRSWVGKTEIVRLWGDGKARFSPAGNPVKAALYSEQAYDLPALRTTTQDRLDQLQKQKWTQVSAARGKSELEQLDKDLKEWVGGQKRRPLALVCVCHGDQAGSVQLDDGFGGIDWVTPLRFANHLHARDVLLVLIACSVGAGGVVQPWLGVAKTVIGMQFEFSEVAAPKLVRALLDPDTHPFARTTPLDASEHMAVVREALDGGTLSYVEASTPVIHSRVSPIHEIRRRSRLIWLVRLLIFLLCCAVLVGTLRLLPALFPGLAPRAVVETPVATRVVETAPTIASVAGRAAVKIDGKEYPMRDLRPIEVKAKRGQTLRIEVQAIDATGQPSAAVPATYRWAFNPLDPTNASRIGTGNTVILYTVPSDRRGQNITVSVATRDFTQTIVIQLAID